MFEPEDRAGNIPGFDPGKAPEGKYVWSATVGEKGQIVIPKQAREVFGIKPGDVLILLGDRERGIAIPPKTQMDRFYMMTFGGPQE